MDVTTEAGAAERTVAARTLPEGEAKVATIARVYPTDQKDLWDACTNAERIPRWFLPITGDLRLGGQYQLEGNAGGTIEECHAPESFRATWEYGGGTSWITVTLSPVDADHTRFHLEHVAPFDDEQMWLQFGPGAVGVGWDMMLYGLTLHLQSPETAVDTAAAQEWFASPEGVALITQWSTAWGEANAAAGMATPEQAAAAAERTTAFYTGS